MRDPVSALSRSVRTASLKTTVVAIRTAESHVENILRKLQFTSRAQVAVWYAEIEREA